MIDAKIKDETSSKKEKFEKELINPKVDLSKDPQEMPRSATETLAIHEDFLKRVNKLAQSVKTFFLNDKKKAIALSKDIWNFRNFVEPELKRGENSGIEGNFASFKAWCTHKPKKGHLTQSQDLIGMNYPQLTRYMGLTEQPNSLAKPKQVQEIAEDVFDEIFETKGKSPSISEWITALNEELLSRGLKEARGGTGGKDKKNPIELEKNKFKKAKEKIEKAFEEFEFTEQLPILIGYIMQKSTLDDIEQIRLACSKKSKELKKIKVA